MSNKLINEMRSMRLPPIYKTVFWVLCDIAADNGNTLSYAPLSRLTNETCLSRDSVIKALSWLESVNLISANRENGRKTNYKITIQDADLQLISAEVSRKKVACKRELPNGKPVDRVNLCASSTSRPLRIEPVDRSVQPVDPSVQPVDAADTNHLVHHIHQERPLGYCTKALTAENPKREKFIKPSLEQVESYFKTLNSLNGETFFDHFQSNGWKVGGKTPMVDWEAAARNWVKREMKFQSTKNQPSTNGKKAWDFDACLVEPEMRTVNEEWAVQCLN